MRSSPEHSEIVVAEFDADTVNACSKADHQKEQKRGGAEAEGQQARKGCRKHERRATSTTM